ncbi:hypothetical protein CEXT_299991 [Caerostris extrusa]|uniref:BPTI/Kunitz inhibitor domain-containing protein n=1 Tax=Caerostris extrusa TaxID=172846 RepID=A0AAV4QRU7_CAEEX|nr:hypothetical protein CEXT_299991 [Caerostris extrusa]
MRKACGASEYCRKLFQLDESHAKSNEEHVSKIKDEDPNTEEVTAEDEDEDEKESASSPSSDDYREKKEYCKKLKKVGPCLAVLRRFYYDSGTRSCEKFTYGGCYGNDNNFHTQKECEEACLREE